MKRIVLLIFSLLPLLVAAQKDSLSSGVYYWKEPVNKGSAPSAAILFEGSTHAMEWMQVSANTIQSSKNKKSNGFKDVPRNEEWFIIIKSGMMNISVSDSSYSISAGSLVLLLPGQKYSYLNANKSPCSYFLFKYRSKQPADMARGNASGGSVITSWDSIEFKPGEKGGRRNFFERPTAMFKRIEAHVTTLKGGLASHAPHTHVPAEFSVVIEGKTEMEIGGRVYKGNQGDIYYATSGILHGIKNAGTENCSYFAIQFE